MAITNTEAAALAAGCVTSKNTVAVMATYKTWLDAQDTAATAAIALITVMRKSKSPTRVLQLADVEYARIESDAPTVTSLSPNTGGTAGGTAVTITGKDFNGATGVTFGGTAATSVVVVSDTSITCVTPAKTAGAQAVAVTTPAGTGTKAGGFTYA